ncbi:MAG: Pr6Pr family membrane protein [Solirubrobacteraceae bacterium]
MPSLSSSAATVERSPQRGALSEPALRVCRALLALVALTAIGYDVAAGPGVTDADYFSYFTVLSNLFAAAMLLHGTLRPAHARSRTVELLRGAAVVYILTTGIVYLLLLSGHAPAYPWVNAILHYVMPVAVTVDWLLDPPRERLDPARTVVLWMAFPLLYIIYTLARGAIVDWYPYLFVNPHRSGGYLLVAGDCLAVGIGIAALIAATTWVGNRRHDALASSLLIPGTRP